VAWPYLTRRLKLHPTYPQIKKHSEVELEFDVLAENYWRVNKKPEGTCVWMVR
jgi:hypothetical protein